MMLGELIPCGGGDVIPLTQSKLLVGRRSRCDITLRYKNVSSHHCELNHRDGYWYVRDLDSSNGVKVNGMRVDSQCLMPGDEVMIASHAFKIEYQVDSEAAPPEDSNPLEMSLMEKAGLQVGASRRQSDGASNRSGSRSVRRNSAKDEFLMEWLSED